MVGVLRSLRPGRPNGEFDEARTVIKWHRQTDYDGDGMGGQGSTAKARRSIATGRQDQSRRRRFLDDDPARRATDCFLGLGMTCTPVGDGGRDCRSPCQCGHLRPDLRFLPGTTRIPERLKSRSLASCAYASTCQPAGQLKPSVRVDPVPGGQLCHAIALRQHMLKVGDSPFAHNYLVFYDDDGNVVSEFHGLARIRPRTDSCRLVAAATISEQEVSMARIGFVKASRRSPWRGSYDEATADGRRAGTRMTRSIAA